MTRGPAPVMWFRQDIRRPVRRAWIISLSLVISAMAVLAVPLGSFERPLALEVVAWIAGGALLLAAPIHLLVRLQRILGPDVYLAVYPGGLVWQAGGDSERFIAWERITRVTTNPDGEGVIIHDDEGDPVRVDYAFIDADAARLMGILEELRTKALMGLPLRLRDPPA